MEAVCCNNALLPLLKLKQELALSSPTRPFFSTKARHLHQTVNQHHAGSWPVILLMTCTITIWSDVWSTPRPACHACRTTYQYGYGYGWYGTAYPGVRRESLATVVVVQLAEDGGIDLNHLEEVLKVGSMPMVCRRAAAQNLARVLTGNVFFPALIKAFSCKVLALP
eukprot:927660-Pelagomonas_calceolata.AAC.2